MKIIPLTGAIGAEILDADVRDAASFPEIRQAFVDHSVIVIRGQTLTPDEQVAFARRFGPIDVNKFFRAHPDNPEVALVIKEPDQREAIGENWHTDHSYLTTPAMCSILYAVETPPTGGDTAFSSMVAACAALSAPMRDFLRGLSAWHSSRHAFGYARKSRESVATGRIGNPDAATDDALHPVIVEHPLSGRPCIYVNGDFTTHIDGLTKIESEAVLAMLYRHCQNPDFQCRVRWQPGDLTIWDNQATWHKAINDYQGFRRHMHRVTVQGGTLRAAA